MKISENTSTARPARAKKSEDEILELSNASREEKRRGLDAIKQLYEDRSIMDSSQFRAKAKKTSGASVGGIEEKDGKTYMVKPVAIAPVTDSLQRGNKDDFIAEEMTAPFYKRFLYDRAPNIGVAVHPSRGADQVMQTSEFIDGFQTLQDSGLIMGPQSEINKIKGFEKAAIVSEFLGDSDWKPDNLGIVSENNITDGGELSPEYHVVKIDHGRARVFPDNEMKLRRTLAKRVDTWNYKKMPMNVDKMIEAIDEINKISHKEIENIVKSSSYRLQKTGLVLNRTFAGVAMAPNKDSPPSYENLEKFYIDKLKKQKEIFKEFRSNLEVISKMDMDPAWKNGQWLSDIKEKDPIVWAKENGKTIEGKHPDVWAAERAEKIATVEQAAKNNFKKLAKDVVLELRATKAFVLPNESRASSATIGQTKPSIERT